jgi:hypothetical protein
LRDDFAFDPAYRTVVGMVLRDREFDAWREPMLEVQQPKSTSRSYDDQKVHQLARNLLTEMEAD